MLERHTLSNEHREIASIAEALGAAAKEPDHPVSQIVRLRWRLAHRLAVHLAKEDRYVYPRLKQSDDPATAAMAERFEAEMGGMAALYQDYMERWDGASIADARERFAAETTNILASLERRIQKEEVELYPRYDCANRV